MTRTHSTGFTLVEVLVALVVLTIGVIGWVASQNSNVRGRDLSGTLAIAQELGRSRVEDLISTALERDPNDGGITSVETYVLSSMTYTVSSTLNATRLESEGKPVWLINVTSSFDRYGAHSVSLERMVVGR